MKKVIVDFSWLMYRSYFAYGKMLPKDNGQMASMFGVLEFIRQVLTAHPRIKLCFCLDSGSMIRKKELKGYKAQRENKHTKHVFKLKKETIKIGSLDNRVAFFIADGFEADDLMAMKAFDTIRKGSDSRDIIIYSGDNDMLQLMKEGVYTSRKFSHKEFEIVKNDYLLKTYEVGNPSYLLEMRSLLGDKSDNIPSAVPRLNKKAGAVFAKLWADTTFNMAVKCLIKEEGLVGSWVEKINDAKLIVELNYILMDLLKYKKPSACKEISKNISVLGDKQNKMKTRILLDKYRLNRFKEFLNK